jgi:hypothetical protein
VWKRIVCYGGCIIRSNPAAGRLNRFYRIVFDSATSKCRVLLLYSAVSLLNIYIGFASLTSDCFFTMEPLSLELTSYALNLIYWNNNDCRCWFIGKLEVMICRFIT